MPHQAMTPKLYMSDASDVRRSDTTCKHTEARHRSSQSLGVRNHRSGSVRRTSAHLWRHVKGRAGAKVGHVRGLGVQPLRQPKVLQVHHRQQSFCFEAGANGTSLCIATLERALTASLTRICPGASMSILSRMLPGVRSVQCGERRGGGGRAHEGLNTSNDIAQRTSVDDALAVQVLEAARNLTQHLNH